jgi:hypothetical protein
MFCEMFVFARCLCEMFARILRDVCVGEMFAR